MPGFPSSTGSRQLDLSIAWSSARAIAAQVKNQASSLRTSSAAGNVASGLILSVTNGLADAKAALNRSAACVGIAAYAQAQIADGTVDVAATFTAMLSAIDGVTSWVVTNFPKDGTGTLLATKFNADNSGHTQDQQFTSAQTAGLRTALDALIAAID